MVPYPDAGFLITLVVQTNGSTVALETLRSTDAACVITSLHELQVRTLLAKMSGSTNLIEKEAAESGYKAWQWFLDEGLLEMLEINWNPVFDAANTLVKEGHAALTPPLLILHPVLAVASRATDFLSFDPRSRVIARRLGLNVLPEKL